MTPTTGLRVLLSLFAVLILLPQIAMAQTTHIVTVDDNFFSPSNLTIQVGDTVEWRNAAGGNSHNVTDNGGSFASATSTSFTFTQTFNSAGTINYLCTIHPGSMTGTITIQGAAAEAELVMNEVDTLAGSYDQGSDISVNAEVENTGNAASGAFSIDYYASGDTTISAQDRLIGTENRASLLAGEDSSGPFIAVIPADLAAGMYFIGAIIDFNDDNLANNIGFEQSAITVTESTGGGFLINAGLNGNWWKGPDRSGEGAQVEISDGGGGSLIVVATVYSYNPFGNQIFVITVGPVNGDTAEVDVFITTGGLWGDDFDPALVVESQWGTGTFTASSCESMHMELRPNAEYQAKGYTVLAYDLIRLTAPAAPCPL